MLLHAVAFLKNCPYFLVCSPNQRPGNSHDSENEETLKENQGHLMISYDILRCSYESDTKSIVFLLALQRFC